MYIQVFQKHCRCTQWKISLDAAISSVWVHSKNKYRYCWKLLIKRKFFDHWTILATRLNFGNDSNRLTTIHSTVLLYISIYFDAYQNKSNFMRIEDMKFSITSCYNPWMLFQNEFTAIGIGKNNTMSVKRKWFWTITFEMIVLYIWYETNMLSTPMHLIAIGQWMWE